MTADARGFPVVLARIWHGLPSPWEASVFARWQTGPVAEHAERPWGTYTVIAEADGFKVKTIEVRPGHRLSYQRHARRSEHWFVVAGHGVVTLDGSDVEVEPGNAVDVARGAAHRIQNTGHVPLE